MSQENRKRVQRLYEAFNRRDFERALTGFAPCAELRPAMPAVDQSSVYHGLDGFAEFWQQISEPFEAVTVEAREMLEAPGERVVAVERWHVRGRDGIELDFELVDVYAFREGLIVRIEGFRDKPAALEAVGLAAGPAESDL